MIKKTIIAIYGRQSEGKSTTIRMIYNALVHPTMGGIPDRPVPDTGEILVIINIHGVRIGIESWGDPGGRMIAEDTLRELAKEKCDIIVCATRTKRDTVWLVDKVATEFEYNTLWTSTYYTPSLSHDLLNRRRAEDVVRVIDDLMLGRG